MKRWTKEEETRLRKLFPNMRTEDVAKKMGRTYQSICQRAQLLGIQKTPEFLQKYRYKKGHKDSRSFFPKGNTPWNKGIRFVSGGKSISTRFSPGHLPHNTLYDGAIVIRTDKSGRDYQYIRIAKGKWVALQRHVWQQHFGPVPPGMIVAFKNRDTMDVRPENLELIDRKENMRRNSIQRYPAELKETIFTLHKLKRTIDEKQNH